MTKPRLSALPWGALLAASLLACGAGDPRAKILEQRARWQVTILNFSQSESGTLNISARLSGPPNSSLQQLTVRIQLTDAEDRVLERIWHTFDLSDVERGGPADRFIRVVDFPHEVFGAGVDMVPSPTPEEQPHIRELAAAGTPA